MAASDWARLRAMVDELTAHAGPFAEWVYPEPTADGVHRLGHTSWGPSMRQAVQTVYDVNLVVGFAWPEWEDGRRLIDRETFDPATLSWAQTVGLLTALIREDRFCEGALAESFENGRIPRLLVRLLDFAPVGSGHSVVE